MTAREVVPLNGCESALVVASLFALAEWPFEKEGARALARRVAGQAAEERSATMSDRWIGLLEAAGLWGSGSRWTPELIAKRAALDKGLELDRLDLPIVIVALRAVYEEFVDDWDEFCTAIPGALDWYPFGPNSVVELIRRFENA